MIKLSSGQKSWQTRLEREGDKALEKARLDGKRGGAISPTNFKNNPELASKAGKISKRLPNVKKSA